MTARDLVVGTAMALLAVGGAHAATLFTPALTYSGGGQSLGDGPFSLGYEFTTNAPVKVVALGIYQANSGGLSDNHDVGLYDSEGDLLASTTIDAPNGSVSLAGFDYNTVPEITLAADATYYVGAEYDDGNDPVLFPGYGGVFSTISSISYVQSTYGNPTGFPNNGYGTNGFFGPNIGVAVPEPATWAMMLLGVGMIGAGLRVARRKNDMAIIPA